MKRDYLSVIPILSLILLLGLPLLTGCNQDHQEGIIGVKIYEHSEPYEQLFRQWKQMGINTGFCSEDLISTRAFMNEARKEGISTFVIFPVFFNPEAIALSPGLAAITRDGEVAAEEWVEFVCPSNPEYRHQVVEHARQIIRDHQPDGISIDFIRHFVYWEKVYPDRDPATLPVACFDSLCLAHFQAETDNSIPDSLVTIPDRADWILENQEEAWTAWRCQLITSMVAQITAAVREEKPDILINIHLVPWTRDDFDGAIERVAGQDVRRLMGYADYLSPMCYAHMLKQPPSWVHHIVEDIYLNTGQRVLPSIQVGKAYLDTKYDLDEFKQTLEAALEAPSAGVVLWSWERLLAEPAKVDLFKDIVTAR
jgi:hypothetical protein